MTFEEMKNLKAGDVVVCMSDNLDQYSKGEQYVIGTDAYGDFGVRKVDDENDAVYSEACIRECNGDEDYEGFNLDDWMLVSDVVGAIGYQLKPGDKVRKVSGEEYHYNIGEEYTIGFDGYHDFGVINYRGEVRRGGYIASKSTDSDFNPEEWVLCNSEESKEATPFKEGDVVRYLGKSSDFYHKGTTYTVGYDYTGDFGVMDGDGDVMWAGIFNTDFFNVEDWELVRSAGDYHTPLKILAQYPLGSKWVYIGEDTDGYPKGFITEVIEEVKTRFGDYGMRAKGSTIVYHSGCIYSPTGYYPEDSFNPDNWVRVVE